MLYKDDILIKEYRKPEMMQYKNYYVVMEMDYNNRNPEKEFTHDFYDSDGLIFALNHDRYHVKVSTINFFEYNNETYFTFSSKYAHIEIRNMKNDVIIDKDMNDIFIGKVIFVGNNIITYSWIWHPAAHYLLFRLERFMEEKENYKEHIIYSNFGEKNVFNIEGQELVYSVHGIHKDTYEGVYFEKRINISEDIKMIQEERFKVEEYEREMMIEEKFGDYKKYREEYMELKKRFPYKEYWCPW